MLGYLSADIVFRGSEQFSECVARGTDNVQGQICETIFITNGGYFVYYPSIFFRSTSGFENWGLSLD